jgi:hypothetical protein
MQHHAATWLDRGIRLNNQFGNAFAVGAIPEANWPPRPFKGKLTAQIVAADSQNIALRLGPQPTRDSNVAAGALSSAVWFVAYLTTKLSGARWWVAFILALALAAAAWAAMTFGPRASRDEVRPDDGNQPGPAGDGTVNMPGGGDQLGGPSLALPQFAEPDSENDEAPTDTDLTGSTDQPATP